MIYKHPDGTYHRNPPHQNDPTLKPIDEKNRPGWYLNTRTGAEVYIEPPKKETTT